jgi:hypothetical protein
MGVPAESKIRKLLFRNSSLTVDRRSFCSLAHIEARRWPDLQTPTLNDAQQDHDDCDDQENVDEATHRCRSDEPEQPKNNENYDNSFKHERHSRIFDPMTSTNTCVAASHRRAHQTSESAMKLRAS